MDEDGFGQLLLRVKPDTTRGGCFFAIGVAFLVVNIGMHLSYDEPKPRNPDAASSALVASLGILVALIFVVAGIVYLVPRVGSEFFFFERGLIHNMRGRQRLLDYHHVAELSIWSQRVHVSGVKIGVPTRLTIRGNDPGEKPFVVNQGGTDAAPGSGLHEIGMHVARVMAEKLAEQIDNDEVVQWTDKMRIHKAGIEVRDGTIVVRDGKLVPDVVPWEKIIGADFDRGKFLLRAVGGRKCRVIVTTDSANFYPGYFCAMARLPNPGAER